MTRGEALHVNNLLRYLLGDQGVELSVVRRSAATIAARTGVGSHPIVGVDGGDVLRLWPEGEEAPALTRFATSVGENLLDELGLRRTT